MTCLADSRSAGGDGIPVKVRAIGRHPAPGMPAWAVVTLITARQLARAALMQCMALDAEAVALVADEGTVKVG